jgi:hypothetical protein
MKTVRKITKTEGPFFMVEKRKRSPRAEQQKLTSRESIGDQP